MTPTYIKYEVVAGGLVQAITLSTVVEQYILWSTGAVTLAGNVTITPSGTPIDGETIKILDLSTTTLNGSTFTVFGRELTAEEALGKNEITCVYEAVAAAWNVIINPASSNHAPVYDGCRMSVWDGTGDTIDLVPGVDEQYQVYTTAAPVAATGSYVVQVDAGYTPVDGDRFTVKYEGEITLGANTITVFGINVPAIQALSGNMEFTTVYDGTTAAWYSSARVLLDDNIYRVMASSGDTSPAYLDSKVKNSVEVNSNDLQLVGDVNSPGNGYYYGTNASGTKGFYPIASNTIFSVDFQIDHADILTLNATPVEIIGNPGVGKAIKVIDYSCSIVGAAGIVTPYITNTTLQLICDTATKPQIYDIRTLVSTIDRVTSQSNSGVISATNDTQIVPNTSLFVNTLTGNPGGGLAGQYIKVKLIYRIIDVP